MADCFRSTNNKYLSHPALMSDGRGFTDYRSSREMNSILMNEMKIVKSYQYKEFLGNNSDNLIKIDREETILNNGYGSVNKSFEQGTMLPEKYIRKCNKNYCEVTLNNKNGLGTGIQYSKKETCNLENKRPESVCHNNLNNVYNS
tara:strand:+ start:3945 stop:4379 length:435 start_codon:yes stop_codon:yes gene_type:complete